RIVDRTGRTQELTYSDEDGDSIADELVEFDDGFGGVTTYVYSSGMLDYFTDANDVTWDFTYNANGTLRSIAGPTKTSTGFQATWDYEYDDATTGHGTLLMTAHEDR